MRTLTLVATLFTALLTTAVCHAQSNDEERAQRGIAVVLPEGWKENETKPEGKAKGLVGNWENNGLRFAIVKIDGAPTTIEELMGMLEDRNVRMQPDYERVSLDFSTVKGKKEVADLVFTGSSKDVNKLKVRFQLVMQLDAVWMFTIAAPAEKFESRTDDIEAALRGCVILNLGRETAERAMDNLMDAVNRRDVKEFAASFDENAILAAKFGENYTKSESEERERACAKYRADIEKTITEFTDKRTVALADIKVEDDKATATLVERWEDGTVDWMMLELKSGIRGWQVVKVGQKSEATEASQK